MLQIFFSMKINMTLITNKKTKEIFLEHNTETAQYNAIDTIFSKQKRYEKTLYEGDFVWHRNLMLDFEIKVLPIFLI